MDKSTLKVLVACEFSGTVRDAFVKNGFDATSCDLLKSDTHGNHYQGDVRDILDRGWDLMIAHPPCQYLSVSGIHWNDRGRGWDRTWEALDFVRLLLDADIHSIALENPVSIISGQIRKPDQIIQPYEFGHDASKKTCFWLKNLPALVPTNFVEGRIVCCGKIIESNDKFGCPDCAGQKVAKRRWANQTDSGQNKLPPSVDRWKKRSVTFPGIADAMAKQWGDFLTK